MAAEYGHEHLAKTIMAKNLDAAKATIRRRFHARIALASTPSWRGYATMLLGGVLYNTLANPAHSTRSSIKYA